MTLEMFCLWLTLNKSLGLRKMSIIVDNFDNYLEFYNLGKEGLKELKFLSPKNVEELIKNKKNNILNATISKLKINKVKFYSKFHSRYPRNLKHIYLPPIVIFVKGELPNTNMKFVTIIGSRRYSEYGSDIAYRLAKNLSKYNICIVSGLAYGIDTFAHKGTLESDGKTISVLGSGSDITYPKENAKLKELIENTCCTISEFPLGTEAKPYNFPIRNRIMAGISDVIVVVEAGINSGTSITVGYGLDEGREILAVPGNIFSKNSIGTNELIKNGAGVLTDYKDVLEILKIDKNKKIKENVVIKLKLDKNEKYIYDLLVLENNESTMDKLIEKSKLTINETQYILTLLEMNEVIKQLPGQRFKII